MRNWNRSKSLKPCFVFTSIWGTYCFEVLCFCSSYGGFIFLASWIWCWVRMGLEGLVGDFFEVTSTMPRSMFSPLRPKWSSSSLSLTSIFLVLVSLFSLSLYSSFSSIGFIFVPPLIYFPPTPATILESLKEVPLFILL